MKPSGRDGGFQRAVMLAVAVLTIGGAGASLFGGKAWAQGQRQQQPGVRPPVMAPMQPTPEVPDSVHARMESQRVRMQVDDRHKRLMEDAQRMVALSNELKDTVEKTGKNELSVDVLRKAAEIEKLAKEVQNRMKG
ncbi:MAG TPA: hypothetical protein VM865_02765 [Acidobacteriaceae bacterium]|jgi:hypothetical protein|nr:hypothetical protein [Acidobacteriaceae bacterium]